MIIVVVSVVLVLFVVVVVGWLVGSFVRWLVGWLVAVSVECFLTYGFEVKGQNARVVTFEDPAKEQSFYLRTVLKTKGTTALGHRRAGFLLIIRFTRLANGCSLLLSSVSLFWKTVGEVSCS